MKDFFKCKECVDLLFDFLEGTLEQNTERKLREHLNACAPCINFVRTYEKCSEMTRRLKEQEVDVPIEVQGRLKSFLHEQAHLLSGPGKGRKGDGS
ncbi:MAG TPA: zf-HC2 domain-containing protein [Acidobacteriota bacterium]|nr:zf-HC2 domain-containing protein [Acidobacteriota bacterium]